MKTAIKKMPLLFLTCLLFCAALLAPVGGGKVSAATEAAPSSIDETNVLDDLKGSTLNGKEFNKDDFAQSDIRDPQIISLVEYGYSFYATKNDDYGLYVYIYNPHAQAFRDDVRNQIQMKAGDGGENTYHLTFLNYSTEVGYEGLFYKYKVTLTDTQKRLVLEDLLRAKRIYKVTEFELVSRDGAVQNYPCATTYTFTGYAKGYGSELAENESTLTCSVDGFEEYVKLNVHQTVYRPHGMFPIEEGGNSRKGQLYDGNQIQINSCYFRVPEKYFTKYGELTKTLCEWYEYQTQPMLVTTDANAYNKLHALHGAPLTTFDPSHNQAVMVMSWGNEYYNNLHTLTPPWHKTPFHWASNLDQSAFIDDGGEYKVQYSDYMLFWPGGDLSSEDWLSQRFPNLAGIFYTNGAYYSAEIPADSIQQELLQNSEYLGGETVVGRYSETLFTDTVDIGHTRGYNKEWIQLSKNENLIWNNAVVEEHGAAHFYDELVKEEESITFQKGITVTNADLKGTDEEISKNLFIAEENVADLKNEFDKAQKNEEKVVLLRYATTNYHSAKAIVKIVDTSDDKTENDKDDTLMHSWMDEYHYDRINGYLAQETVFLNFNVISLWFATDDAETEIPVMMAPQDVISGLQPGVGEEPESIGNDGVPWYIWLILALLIIAVIIVLIIFFPVLRPIIAAIAKGVVFIILLPFKLIGWIAKKISEAAKQRKEEKAAAPPKSPPAKKAANPKAPGNTGKKKEPKNDR